MGGQRDQQNKVGTPWGATAAAVGLTGPTRACGKRPDPSYHVLERGRSLGTGPQMPDPPARLA